MRAKMIRRHSKTSLITAMLIASFPALGDQIIIGNFSQGKLNGWNEESFEGHTQYQLISEADKKILQAKSHGTASGLFRKVTIDLKKTPYLNWSWKIENTFQGNDEQSKEGDDYPARIYVVVSGGLFFWKTKALNYVWSSNQEKETSWDNAYTSNAKMIALRTGDNQAGQWLTEKRNVRKDLKQRFGKEINEIHTIAIMTDSDNTKQQATGYYGDIYFSTD
jgi:hypothetical protein